MGRKSEDAAIVRLIFSVIWLPFALLLKIIQMAIRSKNKVEHKNPRRQLNEFHSQSRAILTDGLNRESRKSGFRSIARKINEVETIRSTKGNGDPEYKGVKFNTSWTPGNSVHPDLLPSTAGIYAEIHWQSKGVRIGETGRSIRGKIKHDIRWFNSMHDGSAPIEQLRRKHPIALAARKCGSGSFSFYVVSKDARLSNKELRQECERFLFQWVEDNPKYNNWNRQTSWR